MEAEDLIINNRWFNLNLINKLLVSITPPRPLLPAHFFSFHLHMFVCTQVVLPQSNQQGKEGFQNQKVNLMVNLEHIQMEVEITWASDAEEFGI